MHQESPTNTNTENGNEKRLVCFVNQEIKTVVKTSIKWYAITLLLTMFDLVISLQLEIDKKPLRKFWGER